MQQLQLRFQLVKTRGRWSTDLLTERRKRRRYTTLSSNTPLVVTCTIVSQDFPPRWTKGTVPNKKEKWKLLGESHFRPIHCKKKKEKKKLSGHNKFNKMAVYAAVTCGMIRDHPGMLRLVGLYCVLTDFCMGRKETERGWILCGKKKNALLGN